jgi:branched-chain amino acid aminotransferase
MKSICFNGKIVSAEEPVLLVSNRGYRYGDGLFETMKVVNGKIALSAFHFERLFAGLSLLKLETPELFTKEKLQQEIISLCKKNNCEKLARIRLSVFRGNGGLYDEGKAAQYTIECWPLNESINKLNANGLVIGFCSDARKSCDKFSNLKSANFLPYSIAAQCAEENKWNDCLVLNTAGNIADSTIANLFIIKDGILFTPPLTEGCINGVMRRFLKDKLQVMGYDLREEPLTVQDIEAADEIFLTNAIKGISWVKQFNNTVYPNNKIVEIYNAVIKTISL